MRRIFYTLVAVLLLIGFAACSDESRNFTMHEPGIYKGTKDPLLAVKEHKELEARFKMVQTDR
jgi:hypothetical protein